MQKTFQTSLGQEVPSWQTQRPQLEQEVDSENRDEGNHSVRQRAREMAGAGAGDDGKQIAQASTQATSPETELPWRTLRDQPQH